MARKSQPKKKAQPKAKYHNFLHAELPINKRGDKTYEPLATAVAGVLSSWESMDERLSFLFSALVQSKNGAASAAYGSMSSFGAQIKMIRAASEAVFRRDHPLRKRIADLTNELNQLHGKRSNVAHGIIRQFMQHTNDKRGQQRTSSSGYFLTPPMHITRKQLSIDEINDTLKGEPKFFAEIHRWRKYAYTAKQVARIEKVINHYPKVITDLLVDVVAEMRKREKERDARIAAKRVEIRQERGG